MLQRPRKEKVVNAFSADGNAHTVAVDLIERESRVLAHDIGAIDDDIRCGERISRARSGSPARNATSQISFVAAAETLPAASNGTSVRGKPSLRPSSSAMSTETRSISPFQRHAARALRCHS